MLLAESNLGLNANALTFLLQTAHCWPGREEGLHAAANKHINEELSARFSEKMLSFIMPPKEGARELQ